MFGDFTFGGLTVICLFTVVWGNLCNQPDDKVVKICRGGSVRASDRIYLEGNLNPADGVTGCTCTATLTKTGGGANSRQLSFFQENQFTNCNYRLEMQRPGISGRFDCLKQPFGIPFMLSSNDQVNINLKEDLSQGKFAQFCVYAQVPQGTVDAEFEITCQQVISGGVQPATTTQPTTTSSTTTQPTTTTRLTTQSTTTMPTTTQATTTTTTPPTTSMSTTTQATTTTTSPPTTTQATTTTTHPTTTLSSTTQATTTQKPTPRSPSTSSTTTRATITIPTTHQVTTSEKTSTKAPDVATLTTSNQSLRKSNVDVFNLKGEVTQKDQSHLIIPVAVGVGIGLIIVAVIAVLLYQKSRRENQSSEGDEEELAEPNDSPDGTPNKDYVVEDVQY